MTERTKTKIEPAVTTYYTQYVHQPQLSTRGTIPGWSGSIRYELGPKNQFGRPLWKRCFHTVSNRQQGSIGTAVCSEEQWGRFDIIHFGTCPNHIRFPRTLNPPKGVWDRGTIWDILQQVDLNCKDSVLVYSGIIQAIPLLGGCLKLNRILKDVARHVKRGMRHQPFTTVMKSLISADFIDRFVIKPTLDDARKFQDATNYVLRVLNTAYERDMQPIGLRATRVTTTGISSSSFTESTSGYSMFKGIQREFSKVTSQAFMKLQVHYDTKAIDPIKLWASRAGLTKPLESVWDLVPFSFVVDYFTRAGDFISQLSEEIDAQEALKGRVSKIYDLWGSLKCEHTFEATAEKYETGWHEQLQYFLPSTLQRTSYTYERFPVAKPWTELSQFKGEDGLLNVDLSRTRLRTLAELFVQAKLKS